MLFCSILQNVSDRNKQLVDQIIKGAICKNGVPVKYWLLYVAAVSRLAHLAVQLVLWTGCVGSVSLYITSTRPWSAGVSWLAS